MANLDANKGKSGGFRSLWYLVIAEYYIYPLTIYSKSDQEDVHPKEIKRLIQQRIKA